MGKNPTKVREYKGYIIAPCSIMTRDERWLVQLSDVESRCPKFCNLSAAMNYVDHIKLIESFGAARTQPLF